MEALRDYQENLLQQVETYLDANDKARVMMQLPTGGGKTVIAGHLLQRRLGNGRKAVWLTHRKELAEQTCGMLTNARVAAVTNLLWTPGTDAPAVSGGAVILMAQTVSRRTDKMQIWNKYDSNDLMVIDEAHHAAARGWERAMQQWPGPVVGMTATPWRLSEKEGFDHLFDDLICGPQIADLQSNCWLCGDKVFMPPPDRRIHGRRVAGTGDYDMSDVEDANSRDIMTAGALKFWKARARDRQTIVYAVSVRHAHNIVKVFQNAGFSAEVILGDTDPEERRKTIAKFRDGGLHVLVNVVVATEGFDLPDASCVLITRPTLSLALFMQMVGRGLRPKEDGGDCIILDLAGNTTRHNLPEVRRKWSLKPRRKHLSGEAPVVWCTECGGVNYAASHCCQHCGASMGKECLRCGKWRPWGRWQFERDCGDDHDLVCDRCHNDAHIQNNLPPLWGLEPYDDERMPGVANDKIDLDIAKQMRGLLRELLDRELPESSAREQNGHATEADKDAVFHNAHCKIEKLIDDACAQDRPNPQVSGELCDDSRCRACSLPGSRDDEDSPSEDPTERLRGLFGEFLDRELHRAAQVHVGERTILSNKIKNGERMLSDDEASPQNLYLDTADGRHEYTVRGTDKSVQEFCKYANGKIGRENAQKIVENPEQEYEEWKQSKKDELDKWKEELEMLESRSIDKNLIFQQARPKIVRFFKIVAKGAKLLPDDVPHVIPATVDGNWHLLSPRTEGANVLPPSPKPKCLRTPDGKDVAIDDPTIADSWKRLLIEIAEWLVRNERIPSEVIPIQSGRKKYLLHDISGQECDKQVKDAQRLSNGLCLHPNTGTEAIRKNVDSLNRKSRLGGHFYVRYRMGGSYVDLDGLVTCVHTHPGLCKYRRHYCLPWHG